MADNRISKDDLDMAVAELSMLQFFPSDPTTKSAIKSLLAKMVPNREALDWLVSKFVNQIGVWHGPVELRGILCQKYQPLDKHEAFSSLPGFSEADAIDRSIAECEQLKGGGWGEPGQRQCLPVSEDSPMNSLVRSVAARRRLQ